MGIEDLTEEDGALIRRKDLTIGDLIDMFGRETTRRALEYMRSLDRADREFRESADSDIMTEGYRRAGVGGDVDPASDKWAAKSRREGLGLDDENTDD